MNARQLVIRFAEIAVSQSTPYCSAGVNGPYDDPATLVRNQSHWLYTLAKCFDWTQSDVFKAEATSIADTLCSNDARPHGFTFLYRSNPNKNRCNGLVGAAWSLEALSEAGEALGVSHYLDTARDIFLLHPQNEKTGLWHSVEIDGRVLQQHETRNQQFWFAASAVKLADDTPAGNLVAERLDKFLENLPNNFSIEESGAIPHLMTPSRPSKGLKQWMREKYRATYSLIERLKHGELPTPLLDRRKVEQLEHDQTVGYHAFNLCALATLKTAFPETPFWQSGELGRAIAYVDSEQFNRNIEENVFTYSYNPVGFEVAYATSVLTNIQTEKMIKIMSKWITRQLEKNFCFESMTMVRNTSDPSTLNARMCELARIDPDLLSRITIS